jgi:hypothetical protein
VDERFGEVAGKDDWRTVIRPDVIFASSSASLLYLRGMWLSSMLYNLSSSVRTVLQYASIFLSWKLAFFMTRSITSYESPLTSMAIRRPQRRAVEEGVVLCHVI